MASHEVRGGHEIGRADGRVAETQVRAGEATRLLRVVREVSLAILVGGVADDLHRVLVGTNGTIGTKTVELSLEHALATECHFLNLRQRGDRYVVDDTHGEVVLRLGQSEVVEHGDDLGRRGVARTQTIASTHDERLVLYIVESTLHVEVQRLALGTRLLRAVEYGDALHGLGHGSQQVLHRERTIEVDSHHTNLLTLSYEVVDSLAGSLGGRTHEDDDALGILGSVVVEEVILTACDFAHLLHVVLHNLRHLVVGSVASLTMCEEGLGVLSSTACHRALR